MAKTANPDKDLREIILALSGEAGGLPIDVIEARLTSPPDRRTLQRRLKELITSGELVSSGKGRATKYGLAKLAPVGDPGMTNSGLLPLSGEARKIRQYVSQPQQKILVLQKSGRGWQLLQPDRGAVLKREKELIAHAKALYQLQNKTPGKD